MKTLRVVVGLILLGAAAIVCVLAIRVASGGREPAAAMRAADAKLGALREEARRIGDLAAGAEARALELRGKLDELKKQAGADASSKGRQPGIIHVSQLVEFDPAFRGAVEKGMKARYMSACEPLYRSLQFSEKERDDFWAIYKNFAERRDDVMQATAKYRMDTTNPGIEALLGQEIADLRKAMTERFGEAREKTFFEFLRKMDSREFADGLAMRVAFTDPLTPEQAERVTQIVAEATPGYVAGKFADNKNVDWTAVDRQLPGVLSAQQFAAWKREGLSGPGSNLSREYMQMLETYAHAVNAERTRKD